MQYFEHCQCNAMLKSFLNFEPVIFTVSCILFVLANNDDLLLDKSADLSDASCLRGRVQDVVRKSMLSFCLFACRQMPDYLLYHCWLYDTEISRIKSYLDNRYLTKRSIIQLQVFNIL